MGSDASSFLLGAIGVRSSFVAHLTFFSSLAAPNGGGAMGGGIFGAGGTAFGGGAIGGIAGFSGDGGTSGAKSAFLGDGGKTKAGGAGFIGSFAPISTLAISFFTNGGGGTFADVLDVGAGLLGVGAENKDAKTSTPVLLFFASVGPSVFATGFGNGLVGAGALAIGGANNGADKGVLISGFAADGGAKGFCGGTTAGGANKELFVGTLFSSTGAATDSVSNITGSGSSSNFFGVGAEAFSLKLSAKINPVGFAPGSEEIPGFGGGENKEFSKKFSPDCLPTGPLPNGGNAPFNCAGG